MEGDRRPTILGLSIALPIISTIAIGLRLQARRINRVKLGADDITILIAFALTLTFTFTILIGSRIGNLGWHVEFTPEGHYVNSSTFRNFGKSAFAGQTVYWPCVGLQKISVLFFYKRIFVGQTFSRIFWCAIGICAAWTIAFQLSVMFSCLPIASRWDPAVPMSRCINLFELYHIGMVSDVVIDGLILFMPIYNVWQLQIRTPQKIAVIGLFSLGGFTTITGIIRLHFWSLERHDPAQFLWNDVSYNCAPVFTWEIVETNTGILSACLPTIAPVFRAYPVTQPFSRFIKSFTSSFRSTTRASKNDIRLNSMNDSVAEKGFAASKREVPGLYQNKAYAEYDGSNTPPPQSPTVIHYHSTFTVSEHPRPGRLRDDV